MPVLECTYELKKGDKISYAIPFSKLSHLSKVEAEDNTMYYMYTVGGAKLYIGKADYDKIYKVMCEQEGVNNDDHIHDN